ncbi:unnamed protein product [Toxocara canis]|uniref:ShKT domain-containing protein n=1 Tax=Toxocara canis TaxID=6265 RepID=A0A183V4U8_TOXCA|nr:unnamed protein product [Toxocara canis]
MAFGPACIAEIRDVIQTCLDQDPNCYAWIAENYTSCTEEGTNAAKYCEKSCQKCGASVLPEYDLRNIPENLQPIAFLVGKWRSEFDGKAFFPTIPKFTYGEEITFRLCNPKMTGLPAFNYTLAI